MNIVLLGLEFNNGNKGCEALSYAFVQILKKNADALNIELSFVAMVYSKSEVLMIEDLGIEVLCVQMKPKKLSFWKRCFRIFKESHAIFDFTMGDSFSDLYGLKRFCFTTAFKQLVIWLKKPLILGPQTYGPFISRFSKKWAKSIIEKSTEVYARDILSREYVKVLCNRDIVEVMDVAFYLPYQKRDPYMDQAIHIGFNPSGLLWKGGYTSDNQFSLNTEYLSYVSGLFDALVKQGGYKIHLIPHVWSDDLEQLESDLTACHKIKEKYPSTIIMADCNTSMEVKSYISAMDVFIGARMHSTIASFSTGVATIPFSYSRKFEGLYNSLDYPFVLSARIIDTAEAIKTTLDWIEQRELLRQNIKQSNSIIEDREIILNREMQKVLDRLQK